MDRKTFLKSLVAAGAALPCFASASTQETGKCDNAACTSDANAVRQFLSDFIQKEESTLDRNAVVKLMQQRGRACCRALKFRQELIEKSAGSTDKLVELMGNIVGAATAALATMSPTVTAARRMFKAPNVRVLPRCMRSAAS